MRPGGGFGGGEGPAPSAGQRQQPMFAVVGADAALHETSGAEAPDDAAQKRLVHAERAADLRGRPARGWGMSQFIEDARFWQRQVGRGQATVQKADLARVKSVELANLVRGARHGAGLECWVKSVVLDNTNESLSAPQAPCERAHKEGGGIARCSAASSMVNYES